MPSRRTEFDPRAILAGLERNYVDYVLIGGLAHVLRGADHVTAGVDICPSFAAGNLERLTRAVIDLAAKRLDGESLEVTDSALGNETVISLTASAGPLQIIGSPAGAPKGYLDLRRAATKEHLGQGIQPLVASVGDLARLAAALKLTETRTSPGWGSYGASWSSKPTANRRSHLRANQHANQAAPAPNSDDGRRGSRLPGCRLSATVPTVRGVTASVC